MTRVQRWLALAHLGCGFLLLLGVARAWTVVLGVLPSSTGAHVLVALNPGFAILGSLLASLPQLALGAWMLGIGALAVERACTTPQRALCDAWTAAPHRIALRRLRFSCRRRSGAQYRERRRPDEPPRFSALAVWSAPRVVRALFDHDRFRTDSQTSAGVAMNDHGCWDQGSSSIGLRAAEQRHAADGATRRR